MVWADFGHVGARGEPVHQQVRGGMGSRRRFGSIRRLQSGRWQARYDGLDLVRYTGPLTFHTKGEAEAWLAQERRLINDGAVGVTAGAGTTGGGRGERAPRPDAVGLAESWLAEGPRPRARPRGRRREPRTATPSTSTSFRGSATCRSTRSPHVAAHVGDATGSPTATSLSTAPSSGRPPRRHPGHPRPDPSEARRIRRTRTRREVVAPRRPWRRKDTPACTA